MEFDVIRSKRKTFAAEIKQNRLLIRAPLRSSDAEIDAFVRQHKHWIETHLAKAQAQQKAAEACPKLTDADIQALTAQAKQLIPARVNYYAPLVGVSYGRITIRHQRTRWGSCNSKGDLNFNCLLMLAPLEVLDSVVVHELCHRKEMNHSDKFYAEVLRVFPDYGRCHKWLKENGRLLMARLEE